MLIIKHSDIRDSIIYIFRYTLTRRSYAVLTGQDIVRYNMKDLSQGDKELFIREITDAEELYSDTVCPIDTSWLKLRDELEKEND